MGVPIYESCDDCDGNGVDEEGMPCRACDETGKIYKESVPGPAYQELGFDSQEDFEDNMF